MVNVFIKDLYKKFGKTEAVKDFNLEVRSGEFFVLLGPSGSGKSTVLNCIAGIIKPTKGEIWIGDKLVVSAEKGVFVPPQERNLGMVFQDFALYPHMSVFDNITFPLKVRKFPEDEVRKRAEQIAETLGIKHLLNRKPGQLSGGEKQRVGLARALIRNPPLLLMDEPLSNLDAKLRVLMRVELKKIQREFKTTVIYVTHDQVEALSMGDRIGVMSAGTLQQVGEPVEIYERPINTFVAGFIGSPPMNMFNCISTDLERGVLECDFGEYKLPKSIAEAILTKTVKELIIGVRPEHVKVVGKYIPGALEAKFIYVEKLGRELIAHLKIGESKITSIISPEVHSSLKETVWILFDENKIHVFDKSSGKAIV
ncbi:MAG: ABC transporter ATP-binding protein [Desulfurococcaceae archaeon]